MERWTNSLALLKMGSKMKKKNIIIRRTEFLLSFLRFLRERGYIYSFNREGLEYVRVNLKYKEDGSGILEDLQIYSKSSKKIYWKVKECGKISKRSSLVVVLTTSQGLMTAREAYLANIGGKLLCSFSY